MDLQLTPYKLERTADQSRFEMSIRYGVNYQEEQILSLLTRDFPLNSSVEVIRPFRPIMFDLEHPMLDIMHR